MLFCFVASFVVLLLLFAYTACLCIDVDPVAAENGTDAILGAKSIGEYKSLFTKLGGIRINLVFLALEIEAPQRIAANKHRSTEEKKKKKRQKLGQRSKV